jgi:hypothetical protein
MYFYKDEKLKINFKLFDKRKIFYSWHFSQSNIRSGQVQVSQANRVHKRDNVESSRRLEQQQQQSLQQKWEETRDERTEHKRRGHRAQWWFAQ